MAIYLDVIWLLNLLVDTMLLWLTALFLKRRIKLLRLLAGGACGSILILMAVTPWHAYAGHPAVKIFFSVMMVWIAFGFKRFRHMAANLLAFYLATFLVGGLLIGVHYLLAFDMQLQSSAFLASVRGFGDPISWVLVFFGLPAAWYASRKGRSLMESADIQYDQLVEVSVAINGWTTAAAGLVDSGNKLSDPVTGLPVMVFSVHHIKDDIPAGLEKLLNVKDQGLDGMLQLTPEWQARLRLIPASSVGNTRQILAAFKPDLLMITSREGVRKVEKGLVAFTAEPLSAEDSFRCIVHPKMMAGSAIMPAS